MALSFPSILVRRKGHWDGLIFISMVLCFSASVWRLSQLDDSLSFLQLQARDRVLQGLKYSVTVPGSRHLTGPEEKKTARICTHKLASTLPQTAYWPTMA